MRVDEDGDLENSTDVINFLVDNFNISMEATDGDASWFNRKKQRRNIIIHSMFREGFLDSNQHINKW